MIGSHCVQSQQERVTGGTHTCPRPRRRNRVQVEELSRLETDLGPEAITKATSKKAKKSELPAVQEPECQDTAPNHHGNGPCSDVNVPGCWFYRLPHKHMIRA
ncbi:hypothetical protein AB205_0177640 [Aquarana catesbeiana]|uniref:Uncharacterized protein n=1 Tax=Aquarana catesbeiana TaxID=8400 RepID=A0A2G9S377_AQUCT|nr:hypothetical protein AB205_0177640 [Aquarana catesbeiana]